jgi:hypothetical protein
MLVFGQVVLVATVWLVALRLFAGAFMSKKDKKGSIPTSVRLVPSIAVLLVGYHLLFSGNNWRPFAGISWESWSTIAAYLVVITLVVSVVFESRKLARLLGLLGIIAVIIAAFTAETRTFDWGNLFDDDGKDTEETVPYDPTVVCVDGDIDIDELNEERERILDNYSGEEYDRRLDAVNALKSEGCPGAAHAAECQNTWALQEVKADNNRVLNGVDAIRTASNDDEAREAAHTWLNQIKPDPDLIVGATSYYLDRKVDRKSLVNGNCASDEAQALVAEIEMAFAQAKITPDDAPSDATNSGVNPANGQMVSAAHAGITGDRTAIKVVLKDGTTVWIMARCGNPVVKGPAPVPPGPTDNPPPSTTTTTVPKTTTTTIRTGKETPATTTPPPPTTTPPPTTATPTPKPSSGDSGVGAPPPSQPETTPTTSAPPATRPTPTTAPPTTRVDV